MIKGGRAAIILLAMTPAACAGEAPADGYMLQQYKSHRVEFRSLQEGLCEDARRWRAYAPDDMRGPAYAMPATGDFGPWMSAEEKQTYTELLHEIGAAYAVVEETEPECLVHIGIWSAPARFSGGYWDTKAWFYGDHWRRKALPVASDGKRPEHKGRAKGVDAIAFRGKLDEHWSVVYYRTLGRDY